MIVEVYGLDDKHVPEIARAIEFFSLVLMEKSIANKIKIHLQFKKRLDGQGKLTWVNEPHYPIEFFMEIKHGRLNEVLKSIAHELVHVKQYTTGELVDIDKDERSMFKGEYYNWDDDNDESYWLLPFEIEAFGWEVSLYQLYAMKYYPTKVPTYTTAK